MIASIAEVQAKWEARRDEWRRLGVTVSGEKVAEEVLADCKALAEWSMEMVTLTEASRQGGYSFDHLQRCVADGKIENVGKKNRPRIRAADVPRKPGYLPTGTKGDQLSDRRRIVAAAKHQEAAS